MAEASDCIFCAIAAGTIPSIRICEDDAAIAFMDINPANPGHCLVISRDHADNLFQVSPASLQAVVFMAQKVARAVWTAMRPDGLNLLQANGPGAAQSIGHFHVHVLPRRIDDDLAMNWTLNPGERKAIEDTARRIRGALRP